MIKTLDLNVSRTKRDASPKKISDKFPSIEDQVQVNPTFERTWAVPTYTVIRGS